jgi:hypothetical protein
MTAALLLAAALASAGGFAQKPMGILLLGEGGDKVWKEQLALIEKRLGKAAPWEFAGGEADQKIIQKAVEKLEAKRVSKIIVVPLYLSSNSDVMDQTRFLFGIREYPVKEFVGRGSSISRRVAIKTPMALAQALDDHAIVVEILAARALALARDAKKDGVFLITPAPKAKESREQLEQLGGLLAEKVRVKAGLARAGAGLLDDKDLRKKVQEFSRAGGAIVVSHALTPSEVERAVPRNLSGVFMRFNGKATIMPDERLAGWIQQAIAGAAMLPDMRRYKDAGRANKQANPLKGGKQ